MANKKRKHRRPIAPPLHSAPGATYTPSGPSAPPVDARPESPSEPSAPPAAPRKQQQQRKRSSLAAKRRRSRRRNYLILGSVVVLIVGALIAQRIVSASAINELNRLSKAAGGSELNVTADSGASDHLDDGEGTTYEETPPTHGPHTGNATIPEGVYDEPFSEDPNDDRTIFKAVHSLEHGAIIIWHDGLSKGDVTKLDRTYRDENKVIVVPYPDLEGDDHVVATAWGREIRMERLSTDAIDKFIELFREARSAPEANVPI